MLGASLAIPQAPAQAQALQPVVDVCTGITLPRSAVTEIIGAVNQPIVDQVETTVNGLTTVTLTLAPLVTLPDLNIDLTTILANAAAGDPITLQILDTDGNVVAPSDDCNITADNIVLDDEGGIEIGGNRISGLGQNGAVASAGEVDAIALGNNASTAAGATGAVAIGTGASVTAANSVALGANSVADRAGTVSVGSAGNERQITNVADGTLDSDAATVGQVNARITAVTDNLVAYDDGTQAVVTFAGADGTRLTNVAPGTVAAGSSDAVNGAQLFAMQQDVLANNAEIAANDAEIAANVGNISANDAEIAANGANISANGAEIAANDADIATNSAGIAANDADIVALEGDVTTNQADIAALADSAVQYDDATNATVTLDGAGGTRITNLADGDLSAGSSDAVNGSQLFATNQAVSALDGRVTQNETDIAANTTAIAGLQTTIGDVQVTVDGLDGRITTNEGDIAALDGRVGQNETDIANLDTRVTTNEGDIANLDTRVTTNEGDIANLDTRVTTNEGDIANLDTRVTTNEGDIANLDTRVTVNEGDIANLDTRVTTNEGNITAIDGRVTTNTSNIAQVDARVTSNTSDITTLQAQVDNVPVGYVSDADGTTPSATPTNTAAFAGAGGGTVRVTNVSDGQLAAGSSDAVTGSQLFATNQAVSQNASDIATINSNISGSTVVAVQYSDPDNPNVSNGGTITNDVALVGFDPNAPVALHNVAAGRTATDAVNLGQLQASVNQAMTGAMNYTDAQIAGVRFDLNELRDDAFAGTAAAMAMASIPQTVEAGRSMVGGSVGHYRGETAFGFGFSTTAADGQVVMKLSGTLDTDGHGGVAAGAGFSF